GNGGGSGGGNGPGPGPGPVPHTSGPWATGSGATPPSGLFTVTVTRPPGTGTPVNVVLIVTGPPTGPVPAAGPVASMGPVSVGMLMVGAVPGRSPLIVAVTVKVLLTGAPSVTVPETDEFCGTRVAVAVTGHPCAPTGAGRARASRSTARSASIGRLRQCVRPKAIRTPPQQQASPCEHGVGAPPETSDATPGRRP